MESVMALWNRDKKDQKSEAQLEAAEKAKATIQELSKLTAKYASSARTKAYTFTSGPGFPEVTKYLRAVEIEAKQGAWSVFEVEIYAIPGNDDDKKIVVNAVSESISFFGAMKKLAENESLILGHKKFTEDNTNQAHKVMETIPENNGQFPTEFFEIEYFVDVCEKEGKFAFDKNGQPHVTTGGNIVSPGHFLLSDITRAKTISETMQKSAEGDLQRLIKKGPLSEIFSQHKVSNTGNLDDTLKKQRLLGHMDQFMQMMTDFNDFVQQKYETGQTDWSDEVGYQIAELNEKVDVMAGLGLRTDPFTKDIAECELTAYMLCAQMIQHNMIENDDYSASSDFDEISELVESASEIYQQKGGSQQGVDRIRSAITQADKISFPEYIGKTIEHYNKKRTEYGQKAKAALAAKKKPAAPGA